MTARKPRPPAGAAGASGEVISLGARAAYRPDYRQLASGRILAAREALGEDHAAFAARLAGMTDLKVSPELLASWERGSMPPGPVVLACTALAGDGAGDFRAFAELPAGAEGLAIYPGRGLISRAQWNGIIGGAQEHLWLYGMAEFGYATDDEVPAILGRAAGAGCQVRVLLLDPSYPAADVIDADEGSPQGTLVTRIKASLSRFVQMRDAIGPQMEIRTYSTHPTVSIVRGDGQMLVTPYLRFSLGSNSPTLDLNEEAMPRTFSRYARHFSNLWNLSKDWT